jgi:hypothetical protein
MPLPLIDEFEAARRLGCSVRSLQKGRYSGTGINPPHVKLGHRVMYQPEAIDSYVTENVRTSTSAAAAA